MTAKEAKIIQDAGIGPLIKKIRIVIESNDYSNYGSIGPFYLVDHEKKALEELGYTLSPLDIGNNSIGRFLVEWD